jgi:sugar lactone lactonase YvrE
MHPNQNNGDTEKKFGCVRDRKYRMLFSSIAMQGFPLCEKELFMSLLKCVAFSFFFLILFISMGIAQSGIITTYVGPGLPVNGELAVNQAIDNPYSIAPDKAGGFFAISQAQNRVYRVEANGKISLAAGNGIVGYSGDGRAATSAQLNHPSGIALDGAGNLYIADTYNNRIRKVTPSGVISTVAGNGTSYLSSGKNGDGGPATSAPVGSPYSVAVDSAGNLYIADASYSRIRKVTTAGIISTVAGNGTSGFSGDGGPATSAQLGQPMGMAVDIAGTLYIADTFNSRVRMVTPAGIISTIAGTGSMGYNGDGGLATSAQLFLPYGVAVDSLGNLYIADLINLRIRKVTANGIITTVAGNGTSGFGGDGGPAISAQLYLPYGVAVDSAGGLYIADYGNGRIRKVASDGTINTVAGNGTKGYGGDGGPATIAKLNTPTGVAVDAAGNVYVADYQNGRIRKVSSDGSISTAAGTGVIGYSGDGGPAASAQISMPTTVTVDAAGNIYIPDYGNSRIRKVTPTGIISTIAGIGTSGFSGDGGPATSAKLNFPTNVAVDSAGNVYIADYSNHRIRKITTAGLIGTIAGTGTSGFSGDGGPATAAKLYYPAGMAVDSTGNLYIADSNNSRIRKITAAGIISTVAGSGSTGYGGDGGLATAALLNRPMGVTVDSENNLVISDSGNNRIRKVSSDGKINTVVGIKTASLSGSSGFSGDNGAAAVAQLYSPYNVAIDSAGSFYIADSGNHRIRKITSILNCSSLNVNSSGVAACQTAGKGTAGRVGYAKLAVNTGSAPYGTAVFSLKQNGVTVTQAGVPASPPTTQARIFIDYRDAVSAIPGHSNSGTIDINTGLAVVNYGAATASIVYTLRDFNGVTLAVGHGTIAAGNHIACFINQLKEKAAPDFNLPSNFQSSIQFGTLEIAGSQPISVVGMRGINNQRKEFLITTTPGADLTKEIRFDSSYFPQFIDGGGYITSLILMNTSDQIETGSLQILDNNGAPLVVRQVGGATDSTFYYAIPAGGAFRFQADGFPADAKVGWVRLVPRYLNSTPVGSGVYTYNPGSVLVSESGIPSAFPTTHARIYVDLSKDHNTGLAIANISGAAASITINAYQPDGVTEIGTSWGPLELAAYGHDAKFADQLIEGLPEGYRGVLDIRSTAPFAALTVRSIHNERDEFLMSTFPIADANRAAPLPIAFPQVTDGGGYVTEFMLISAGAATSTTPGFYDEAGALTDFSH